MDLEKFKKAKMSSKVKNIYLECIFTVSERDKWIVPKTEDLTEDYVYKVLISLVKNMPLEIIVVDEYELNPDIERCTVVNSAQIYKVLQEIYTNYAKYVFTEETLNIS